MSWCERCKVYCCEVGALSRSPDRGHGRSSPGTVACARSRGLGKIFLGETVQDDRLQGGRSISRNEKKKLFLLFLTSPHRLVFVLLEVAVVSLSRCQSLNTSNHAKSVCLSRIFGTNWDKFEQTTNYKVKLVKAYIG